MLLTLALAVVINTSQLTPAPGAEARQEMSRLAYLAGSWVARIEIMQQDGTWEVAGEERVEIRYLLDGLALREEPAEHPVNPFRLEATLQYDQNRDVYRLAAMDDTWGNMDIYEGGWNGEGALVLTNLRAGTRFENPDGTSLSFRLTTRIDGPNANVFQVDMTADHGETWRPYQRISRTRYAIQN